jgi:hypothetical protein
VAKHGVKTFFYEVGNTRHTKFFENHFVVETALQAKEAVEADYRKDVIIE